MSLTLFLSAFVVGLMGAGHCLGMCGGIVAALSFAIPDASSMRRLIIILTYNLGRITSYVVLGVLVGAIGLGADEAFSHVTSMPVLRVLAGVMLILMGFYIAGWWKVLGTLETLGARVWSVIQPIGNRILPVESLPAAFSLGFLWGWLPCGLVYSALALALSQADPWASASVMLGFGCGTLPAVVMGGVAGEKLKAYLQLKSLRILMGLSVIVFGVWTLFIAFLHSGHVHGESASEHMNHHPSSSYTEEMPDSDSAADGAHHHH
ncbi:MAG: sulfite exporter TauE/SafE family protein [Agarilytica sp.]